VSTKPGQLHYVDFPEWEEWLGRMKDFSASSLQRRSFDLDRLVNAAWAAESQPVAAAAAAEAAANASTQRVNNVILLNSFLPKQAEFNNNTARQTEIDRVAPFSELAA
jgi:hypothetical protein